MSSVVEKKLIKSEMIGTQRSWAGGKTLCPKKDHHGCREEHMDELFAVHGAETGPKNKQRKLKYHNVSSPKDEHFFKNKVMSGTYMQLQ